MLGLLMACLLEFNVVFWASNLFSNLFTFNGSKRLGIDLNQIRRVFENVQNSEHIWVDLIWLKSKNVDNLIFCE